MSQSLGSILTVIILGLSGLGYLVLALKRFDWALLVIIALLPSYLIRFKFWGIPLTWLEIMIMLSFIVYIWRNWQVVLANINKNISKRSIAWRYPFDWEMLAWLIIALIAVMTANFETGAFGIWKAYFFEAIIFYLLFVNTFTKDKSWPRAIWALAVSAFLISLVGWYQQFIDMEFLNPIWSHQTQPRITSVFPYSNAVGLYLGPIVILMIAYARKLLENKNSKSYLLTFLLALISLMSLMSIVFARSEGAILGVVTGIFLLVFFSSKRLAFICSLVFVCILIMVVTQSSLRNYIIEKTTLSDLSGEIRRAQWQETKKMLTSNPRNFFLGAGLNNYPEAVKNFHVDGIFFNFDNDPRFREKLVFGPPEYKKTHWQPVQIYQYPHNILLNFWSELGLVGLLLAIWLTLKFFYQTAKLYKRSQDILVLGLACSLLVWLVHGLVDVPYFKNDLSVLWWLLFAILGSMLINDKYERSLTKTNS